MQGLDTIILMNESVTMMSPMSGLGQKQTVLTVADYVRS